MDLTAINTMRTNAINQDNAKKNSAILTASQMTANSTKELVEIIKPALTEIAVGTREDDEKIITTFSAFGKIIEVVTGKISDHFDEYDEVKEEERERDDAIVGLLTGSPSRDLVTTEPTTETKPLMIAKESLNQLAEIILPKQAEMTNALTTIGDNIQSIQNQTYEIVKSEKEAKIDALVKPTETPKELPQKEDKKKWAPDFSGFFNGIKVLLKKFLSPVAWIAAFIQEILPWVLIFGALFIGFWETASTKVRMYAIGVFASILLAWRVLTGRIFKDVKLLLTVGKKLWEGAVWLSKKLHIYEHAVKLKNLILEKVNIIKEWTLKKAIALKEFAINKAIALKKWTLSKAIALKEFAINKATALKKWALDLVHHAARMLTTAKENLMNTTVHAGRIGNIIKEAAMTVAEHVMKLANIVKDFAMSVIRHTADMARIAYGFACEMGKFIKEMIVTGLKMIHAIALFIADMARVVFQIAMAAAQYLLIAAAIVAIVALVGLIIYALVNVAMKIIPMITQVITTFLSAAWNIIKDIASTIGEFLAPVGKAVIEFLASLNPITLIVRLIKGIASAIKDFFAPSEKEQETQQEVSKEAAQQLGVTEDDYNRTEQQKMNLFDSRMNAVLRQLKDISEVITLSAAATLVTAKFFGVNPQNGQAAPQGTSMFAQTVATDGSNARESIAEEKEPIDYNKVFEQMVKILGEIRDKKTEVQVEKKTGLFNLF